MRKEKYIIIHNPRCGKSRNALTALKNSGKDPEVRLYLNDHLSKAELLDILNKLNLEAVDLVRKNEKDFKENFKGKKLSTEEWVEAMVDYPKLIQRPIIIKGDNAIIARSSEAMSDFL